MPTTPSTSRTAPTVDEQFLDLICGDADLLAAEFDAIIAADGRCRRSTDLVAALPAGTLAVVQPAAQPTPSAAWSSGPATPASADGPGSAHPRSDTRCPTPDIQEGR